MGRIRPASRSQAKPLIGLYSESGAGKTYTALLLARGFVGPTGRICMVETESGRGESYAKPDEYPELRGPDADRNYDVLPLRENFSPEEYGKAITEIEQARFDAMIIDSASHEWEGAGGVLDMASKREADGKKGMLVWQQPKIDHQKHFMLRFMQTPIPLVILNMRAKYPMVEVWNERKQKKEPQRSTQLEPKQSEDILYEMFVHGWIQQETHNFMPTKITAKSLQDVFAAGKPISLETGRQLKAWAIGGKDVNPGPVELKPGDPRSTPKAIGSNGQEKLFENFQAMGDFISSTLVSFNTIEQLVSFQNRHKDLWAGYIEGGYKEHVDRIYRLIEATEIRLKKAAETAGPT